MTIGIPSPIMQYRFRVIFGNKLINHISDPYLLIQSIESISYNLVKQEIYITIRQPATVGVVTLLDAYRQNPYESITIDTFRENNETYVSIVFERCAMIDHISQFSYSEIEVAKHKMTFKYEKVYDIEPQIPEDADLPEDNESLTPQEVLNNIKAK